MATSVITKDLSIKYYKPSGTVDYDGTNTGIVNFLNAYNSAIASGITFVEYNSKGWQRIGLLVNKVNDNYGYAIGISYYNKNTFRLSSGTWNVDQ